MVKECHDSDQGDSHHLSSHSDPETESRYMIGSESARHVNGCRNKRHSPVLWIVYLTVGQTGNNATQTAHTNHDC